MKLRTILIFLPFAFCALTTSNAQQTTERIRFEHLTVADGLPDNNIIDIIQDRLGFIWMATLNGLARYDGNKITTYHSNPNKPYSLKSNTILVLHEDANGDIWIGSGYSNLLRFERSTQKFVEYPNKNSICLDTKNEFSGIFHIHEDKKGNIWTISDDRGSHGKAIDRLNPKTNTWTAFRNTNGDNQGFSDYNTPGDLLNYKFTKNGEIWITISGEKENSLFQFDEKSDKFIRFIAKPQPEISEDFKHIDGIESDNKGQKYFTSLNLKSFFSLNPQTGNVKEFKHNPQKSNSPLSDTISSIYVDSTDLVWIVTSQGIDKYDPMADKFTHYFSKPNDIFTPSKYKNIYGIFEDIYGNIWFTGHDEA